MVYKGRWLAARVFVCTCLSFWRTLCLSMWIYLFLEGPSYVLTYQVWLEEAQAFVSCCVTVRNVERNVFVLPRSARARVCVCVYVHACVC